jgi:tyrosine-protein phosphatase YwqE
MKFEIKITDEELNKVNKIISMCIFPVFAKKKFVAVEVFGNSSDWGVRKVREAVSRLQSKGHPIIAHHGGYSVFGDDPAPVIEYLNREYSRVYEATKKNDQLFAAMKRKYGDSAVKKIEVIPGQPILGVTMHNV